MPNNGSPQNPQTLQVVPPQAAAPEAPALASAQVPIAEPVSMEDRILTTEEVERVFKSMDPSSVVSENSPHQSQAAVQDLLDPSQQGPAAIQQAREQVDIGSQTPEDFDPQSLPQSPAQDPTQPPVGAFVQPQPQPQQVPVQTPPTQREQLLEAQIQALQTNVQQLTTALQAQSQQPATQPAKPAVSDTKSLYAQLQNVNPQLSVMLGDENPANRHQALQTLVGGIAETIHETVMSQVEQRIQQTVPRMIQGTVQQSTEAQRIEQDFFGTYPEFADMQPTVVATAQEVMQQTGITQYTPALRDEIARRLAPLRPTVLQRMGQQQAPQQVPVYASQTPPQYAQAPNAAPTPVQTQPVQGAPVLVRDASGQLVPMVQPGTPYVPPTGQMPHMRTFGSEEQDIWGTLGY